MSALRKLAGWQRDYRYECPEEVGRLAGGLQVPECPEEVGRLTGQSLAGVKHVEEEGELAGQAGLTRAEVAQNNDPQFF